MRTGADGRLRRALDVAGSLVGIAVCAPFPPLVWLVVRLDSRGPLFHRAQRVGRGGTDFTLWKLRTMRPDGAAGGPAVTPSDDRRVTRVGRVLRRSHLDELPQLVNVLRGDMSLVGPRPEAPVFVDGKDTRWSEVLSVRPGITGPTQLRFVEVERRVLRGDRPDDVYRARVLPAKLESDVAYVRSRTLAGDLTCLLRTLLPGRAALGGGT